MPAMSLIITAGIALWGISQSEIMLSCNTYDQVAANLVNKYGEHQAGSGISVTGRSIVELWHNPDTGTWTLVVVARELSGTQACILGSGEEWQIRRQQTAEPEL